MTSRTYKQTDKDRPATVRDVEALFDQYLGQLTVTAKPEQYLSTTEAARRLGISRAKVYDLFASDDLHRHYIGRRAFVLEAELERFMSRQGQR